MSNSAETIEQLIDIELPVVTPVTDVTTPVLIVLTIMVLSGLVAFWIWRRYHLGHQWRLQRIEQKLAGNQLPSRAAAYEIAAILRDCYDLQLASTDTSLRPFLDELSSARYGRTNIDTDQAARLARDARHWLRTKP